MQHQLEGWKQASIYATGTLNMIGVAVGGTTAVFAHGTIALLRGVAVARSTRLTADDCAKAATQNILSSTGEQIQQAAAAARSTSLTADDSAKAATQNLLSLPHVADPPAEPTRPTRSTQSTLPGIADAASDSGFFLVCNTHNPSHDAHLYRGDCLKRKRPAVRSPTPEADGEPARSTSLRAIDSKGPSSVQCHDGIDSKLREELVALSSNHNGKHRDNCAKHKAMIEELDVRLRDELGKVVKDQDDKHTKGSACHSAVAEAIDKKFRDEFAQLFGASDAKHKEIHAMLPQQMQSLNSPPPELAEILQRVRSVSHEAPVYQAQAAPVYQLTVKARFLRLSKKSSKLYKTIPQERILLSALWNRSTMSQLPQMIEEVVEVPKIVSQDRIQKRTVEQIVYIPVPQIVEELVEGFKVLSEDRVQQLIVEHDYRNPDNFPY